MKENWTFEAEEVSPELSQAKLNSLIGLLAELLIDHYLNKELRGNGSQSKLTVSLPEEQ